MSLNLIWTRLNLDHYCSVQFRYSVMNKILSGRLRRLKNKEKVQLDNPKSGRGRLWERSLTTAFHYKVEVIVQTGFYELKVVVTRAGCLREWWQGEL